MSIPGFGKPKYGNNTNYAKNLRPKEGAPIVARILPPMKSLAETGEWAKYIGTHFGYRGVNSRDPSKPQLRTFECIEERNFQTKMVTQDCPECDLIAQRENELAELKAQAKADGHSEDEIKELAKPHSDWLRDHNCDRKWHMNVMLQDGSFAVLQISHKTKKLLEQKIMALQTEDGIDALDLDQGVWFVIKRSGRGIESVDTVDVEYESVRDATTGRISRTVKLAPVSLSDAQRALQECPDLAQNVRKISYEQIRLLTLCSGEPEDVDAILAMGQRRESSPLPPATPPRGQSVRPPSEPPTPAARSTAPTTATSGAVAAPATTAPATEPPVGADDEVTRLMAQLEAAKARAAQAAQQPAAPAPVPEPAAPVQDPAPVPATPAAAPAEGLPVDRAAFMARFRSKQ